jgi:hypothetical protein
MKRFFDYAYIKEGSTPIDTIALSTLNSVDWKKFELRDQSKITPDKDGETNMGDGTKRVSGEKAEVLAQIDYTPETYTTLRSFINKKCTIILIDSDYPDASGDYQACPAIFGVRPFPKKVIESGADPYIEISGDRSAGDLLLIQRDITITN